MANTTLTGLTVEELEVAQCRIIGHQWAHNPAAPVRASFGRLAQFVCRRCSTVRNDVYAVSGHLTSRWYNYSDSYAAIGMVFKEEGTDKVQLRVQLRQQLMKRVWKVL